MQEHLSPLFDFNTFDFAVWMRNGGSPEDGAYVILHHYPTFLRPAVNSETNVKTIFGDFLRFINTGQCAGEYVIDAQNNLVTMKGLTATLGCAKRAKAAFEKCTPINYQAPVLHTGIVRENNWGDGTILDNEGDILYFKHWAYDSTNMDLKVWSLVDNRSCLVHLLVYQHKRLRRFQSLKSFSSCASCN